MIVHYLSSEGTGTNDVVNTGWDDDETICAPLYISDTWDWCGGGSLGPEFCPSCGGPCTTRLARWGGPCWKVKDYRKFNYAQQEMLKYPIISLKKPSLLKNTNKMTLKV